MKCNSSNFLFSFRTLFSRSHLLRKVLIEVKGSWQILAKFCLLCVKRSLYEVYSNPRRGGWECGMKARKEKKLTVSVPSQVRVDVKIFGCKHISNTFPFLAWYTILAPTVKIQMHSSTEHSHIQTWRNMYMFLFIYTYVHIYTKKKNLI